MIQRDAKQRPKMKNVASEIERNLKINYRSNSTAKTKIRHPVTKTNSIVPNELNRTTTTTKNGHVVKDAETEATLAVDGEGRNELHWAAYNGNVDKIQQLVCEGVAVDVADHKGKTALILAAYNGHVDVIHQLLNAGANVNAVSKDGKTALTWAVLKALEGEESRLIVVKLLLERGADVNIKDVLVEETALMLTAIHGNVTMVEMLLKAGADVHAANKYGMTALKIASFYNHDNVVKILQGAAII